MSMWLKNDPVYRKWIWNTESFCPEDSFLNFYFPKKRVRLLLKLNISLNKRFPELSLLYFLLDAWILKTLIYYFQFLLELINNTEYELLTYYSLKKCQVFTPLVEKCKKYGRAMRIGTNHGSLSDRIMSYYGDSPRGMVSSPFPSYSASSIRFLCIHVYSSESSFLLSNDRTGRIGFWICKDMPKVGLSQFCFFYESKQPSYHGSGIPLTCSWNVCPRLGLSITLGSYWSWRRWRWEDEVCNWHWNSSSGMHVIDWIIKWKLFKCHEKWKYFPICVFITDLLCMLTIWCSLGWIGWYN